MSTTRSKVLNDQRAKVVMVFLALVLVATAITVRLERHGLSHRRGAGRAAGGTSVLKENGHWAASHFSDRWRSSVLLTSLHAAASMPQSPAKVQAWRNQLGLPDWVPLPWSGAHPTADTYHLDAYGYPFRHLVDIEPFSTSAAQLFGRSRTRQWGLFAANVAIITSCLVPLAAIVVFGGRRLVARRRSGECRCGYSKAGLNTRVCPECGVDW